jgi:predicted acetyltransferase
VRLGFDRFRFFDPGQLVDRELALVAPHADHIPDVLAACQHPLTVQHDPSSAATTRDQLEYFLRMAPGGRQPADAMLQRVPAYHFWMKLSDEANLPIKFAGGISLRIGSNPDLERYVGHIGYGVYPPARGHHFAERSCRLLFPLARWHGLFTVWITCNPENLASRRTCERLGATLVEIVPVPKDHALYARGDHAKCRFRVDL